MSDVQLGTFDMIGRHYRSAFAIAQASGESEEECDTVSKIERIEVDFAVPVELSHAQMTTLSEVIQDIAKSNEPEGHVHWQFGAGSKPMFSDADYAAFPDLKGGRSGQPKGEPTFDDSVLHFSTACRERYESETAGPDPLKGCCRKLYFTGHAEWDSGDVYREQKECPRPKDHEGKCGPAPTEKPGGES